MSLTRFWDPPQAVPAPTVVEAVRALLDLH